MFYLVFKKLNFSCPCLYMLLMLMSPHFLYIQTGGGGGGGVRSIRQHYYLVVKRGSIFCLSFLPLKRRPERVAEFEEFKAEESPIEDA